MAGVVDEYWWYDGRAAARAPPRGAKPAAARIDCASVGSASAARSSTGPLRPPAPLRGPARFLRTSAVYDSLLDEWSELTAPGVPKDAGAEADGVDVDDAVARRSRRPARRHGAGGRARRRARVRARRAVPRRRRRGRGRRQLLRRARPRHPEVGADARERVRRAAQARGRPPVQRPIYTLQIRERLCSTAFLRGALDGRVVAVLGRDACTHTVIAFNPARARDGWRPVLASPKAPKSAYEIFCDVEGPTMKEQFPDIEYSESRRRLAEMYRSISDDLMAKIAESPTRAKILSREIDAAVSDFSVPPATEHGRASDRARRDDMMAKIIAELEADQERYDQETAAYADAGGRRGVRRNLRVLRGVQRRAHRRERPAREAVLFTHRGAALRQTPRDDERWYEGAWRQLGNLKRARVGAALVEVAGRLYITGVDEGSGEFFHGSPNASRAHEWSRFPGSARVPRPVTLPRALAPHRGSRARRRVHPKWPSRGRRVDQATERAPLAASTSGREWSSAALGRRRRARPSRRKRTRSAGGGSPTVLADK